MSFAIVGMVVSSCTVEDIKTIFTPKNAEAEITVLVLDIVNGKDVTTEAKLSTNSRFTQTFYRTFRTFSIRMPREPLTRKAVSENS